MATITMRYSIPIHYTFDDVDAISERMVALGLDIPSNPYGSGYQIIDATDDNVVALATTYISLGFDVSITHEG